MNRRSVDWCVDVEGTWVKIRTSARPDDAHFLTVHEVRVLQAQLHLASLLAVRNQAATGVDLGASAIVGEISTYSALTRDELSLREVKISDDLAAEALNRYKKYVDRYLAGTVENASGDTPDPTHVASASGETPDSLPRDWRIVARGRSVELVVPASADDGRFIIGIDEAIAAGVALIQQAERARMAQEEGRRDVGGAE